MSTPELQIGGTLYSDMQDHQDLNPEAQLRFDQYLAKLKEIRDIVNKESREETLPDGTQITTAWQDWEYGLRQFYKEIISDAFKAHNIEVPKGMEVHFAGSLAKAQATEFSDLDAFVIVENKEDTEKVKPVFDALNNVCQRIFKETHQMYPDPIGINPSRLIGTVDELVEQIDGGVLSPEATALSVISSKPIYPRYALGEQLRQKIHENDNLGPFCTAEALYNKAITDFTAPKPNAEHINIKTHIMRPIDFILMGLREEFALYNEAGSHLSTPGTIKLLREKAELGEISLPKEEIDLIESVYNKAMAKRFDLHSKAGKEQDEMPYADAKDMLDQVAQLREMASKRVENLEKASQKQQAPTEQKHQEQGFFSRNADTLKKVGIVSLIVLAAVGVGVGLALGGVLAVPFAVAAGAAVVGVAAIGYGLFKAGEAIGKWLQSRNKEPAAKSEGLSTEKHETPDEIPIVSPGLSGLGPRVEQSKPAQAYVLEQDKKDTVTKTATATATATASETETETETFEPEEERSGLSMGSKTS